METTQMAADRIEARKQRVVADIEKHKQAIERHTSALNTLSAEMKDIETAERVLISLGLLTVPPPAGELTLDDIEASEPAVQKPEGTPPMTDMIREALENAHRVGCPGLEPLGILPYIQGRWWPNATSVSVGPIAWRMWKRGELVKDGGRYALPNAESFYPENGGGLFE